MGLSGKGPLSITQQSSKNVSSYPPNNVEVLIKTLKSILQVCIRLVLQISKMSKTHIKEAKTNKNCDDREEDMHALGYVLYMSWNS